MAPLNKSDSNDAPPPDLVDDDGGADAPVLTLVVIRGAAAGGTDPARVDARCAAAALATRWAERDNAAVDLGAAWTTRVLACDDAAALDALTRRARSCGVRAREFPERGLLALGPGDGAALAAVTDGPLVRPFPRGERAGAGADAALAETLRVTARVRAEYRAPATKKKPKPNDKCDCGSGRKFKKCCAGQASLEDAVRAALGQEAATTPAAGPLGGKGGGEDREGGKCHVVQGGEKVAGFRKQVEYGAKKYIKP